MEATLNLAVMAKGLGMALMMTPEYIHSIQSISSQNPSMGSLLPYLAKDLVVREPVTFLTCCEPVAQRQLLQRPENAALYVQREYRHLS